MGFKKGQSGNPNGRVEGSKNKLTKTVKETFLAVFLDIQSDPKINLAAFAKENTKEFYQLASKLIPTEVSATIQNKTIKIIDDTE